MSQLPKSNRPPHAGECFNAQKVYDLIIWNAPDHQHTRSQLRRELEEIVNEQYEVYETFGGDAAQGLKVGGDPE